MSTTTNKNSTIGITDKNSNNTVILKLIFNKFNQQNLIDSSFDRTISVNKNSFKKIGTKESLTKFLLEQLPSDNLINDNELIYYQRKSKKFKTYVDLATEDDFRSLQRSLKVKNHVKLLVNEHPLKNHDFSDSTSTTSTETKDISERFSSASSSSSSTKLNNASPIQDSSNINGQIKHDNHAVKNKSPFELLIELLQTKLESISDNINDHNLCKKRKFNESNFTALGDALVDSTFEHLKDLFYNLSCSEDTKEQKQQSENEPKADESAHAPSNTTLPVHSNICCDICYPDDFVPLRGIRYCCLVCSNFDLCSNCELKQQQEKLNYGAHLHSHPMAKITQPTDFRGGLSRLVTLQRVNDTTAPIECDASVSIDNNKAEDSSDVDHQENCLPKPDSKNVTATIVPKSEWLAQVILTNKSDLPIDCRDLTIQVINCFNTSIAEAKVSRKQDILPNKTAKFNINLSHSHLKHPFKLVLKNNTVSASCDLNQNNLSGVLNFEQLQNKTFGSPTVESNRTESSTHTLKANESTKSDSDESHVTDIDSSSSHQVKEDDYEIISSSNEDDSDFEIL